MIDACFVGLSSSFISAQSKHYLLSSNEKVISVAISIHFFQKRAFSKVRHLVGFPCCFSEKADCENGLIVVIRALDNSMRERISN